MKKICKWVYAFLVDLINTIVSACSVVLFSNKLAYKYFKSVIKYSTNNTLYILGNGSSLNQFLESGEELPKDIMVVNHFAKSEHFKKVQPRHYIIVDNNLCIAPETEKGRIAREELIKSFLSVDWNMNLYMPSDSNKEMIRNLKSNPNLNIILFNRTPVKGFNLVNNYLYDLRWGMPIPQNVTNAAVFCGIAAGFKTIFLYGAEHSWAKSFDVDPETHQIYINDGHFYEKDNVRLVKKGVYKEWLYAIYLALKSHEELRRYADIRGVKIINKSPQSFVDAYDFE